MGEDGQPPSDNGTGISNKKDAECAAEDTNGVPEYIPSKLKTKEANYVTSAVEAISPQQQRDPSSAHDQIEGRNSATPISNNVPHRDRADSSTSKSPSSPSSTTKFRHLSLGTDGGGVSEWSHQQLAPHEEVEEKKDVLGGWQQMPAYAEWDMFDDDGRLVAKAHPDSDNEDAPYAGLGGAGKGYTRVQIDEDAKSTTSLDDNTAYLFKDPGTNINEEDEEARDPLQQMQATKDLLNDNQKIAYVGLVRLAMAEMLKLLEGIEKTRGNRKQLDLALEAFMMWTQKMMLRLYGHMELDSAEQVMIEQLSEHGLQPGDLTPSLMENSRVSNPMRDDSSSPRPRSKERDQQESELITERATSSPAPPSIFDDQAPPQYEQHEDLGVQLPSELPQSDKIDIDLRWTVLCDLFLVLIADSMYDARSRALLERVGLFLDVSRLDICRFEKRITDSLEMQEEKEKEKWNEEEHVENRRKLAKRRRLMMMGLATAGGTLVIGLSGGLLGPLIGAGLAAGFTTIGVTGTSGFLAGAAGAAIVGTGSAVAGGAMGAKASNRRTGAVSTFEYRPLYNNKRVNLILTIAGWLNGKVDDPRLPFSTIDPVMGDLYSLWWEPEMLTSMGQTLTILATEALTQALQQVLASTILTPLMGALQLPIILSKLTYLVDNPWSVSLARADRAGLILADSLVDRNLGARPITLVGFSIGSRVIFAALQELAKRGAVGLVQNVFLFGSPMVVKKDDYVRARTVVADRFVNGYSETDWILGYLFRATSGGVMRVAGLASVDIAGVENFKVTQYVNGHMAYRKAMPKLLREVGFAITSDEFSEIEDADPDNHEARQRQLIDEIEEARKELHDKQDNGKKGWGWFKRKKAAEKRSWEIYDDRSQKVEGGDSKDAKADPDGILFDVDAIKKEVVELGAQGLEVKQLESTMPTLKLDGELSRGAVHRPMDDPRATKSDIALPLPTRDLVSGADTKKWEYGYDDYNGIEDGEVTMSFAPSEETRPTNMRTHSDYGATNGITTRANNEQPQHGYTPAPAASSEKNVWSDEDEFAEQEVEMTFA